VNRPVNLWQFIVVLAVAIVLAFVVTSLIGGHFAP